MRKESAWSFFTFIFDRYSLQLHQALGVCGMCLHNFTLLLWPQFKCNFQNKFLAGDATSISGECARSGSATNDEVVDCSIASVRYEDSIQTKKQMETSVKIGENIFSAELKFFQDMTWLLMTPLPTPAPVIYSHFIQTHTHVWLIENYAFHFRLLLSSASATAYLQIWIGNSAEADKLCPTKITLNWTLICASIIEPEIRFVNHHLTTDDDIHIKSEATDGWIQISWTIQH